MAADDTVDQVREVSRESCHLRLVVWRRSDAVGMVHVRDALAATAGTTAVDLVRPVLTGPLLGVVTMQDVLDRLLPDPDRLRVSGEQA